MAVGLTTEEGRAYLDPQIETDHTKVVARLLLQVTGLLSLKLLAALVRRRQKHLTTSHALKAGRVRTAYGSALFHFLRHSPRLCYSSLLLLFCPQLSSADSSSIVNAISCCLFLSLFKYQFSNSHHCCVIGCVIHSVATGGQNDQRPFCSVLHHWDTYRPCLFLIY